MSPAPRPARFSTDRPSSTTPSTADRCGGRARPTATGARAPSWRHTGSTPRPATTTGSPSPAAMTGIGRALAGVVATDWSADPRWTTLTGRVDGQDELDGLLAAWTGSLDRFELAAALRTVGVPAAAVQRPSERIDARSRNVGLGTLAHGHALEDGRRPCRRHPRALLEDGLGDQAGRTVSRRAQRRRLPRPPRPHGAGSAPLSGGRGPVSERGTAEAGAGSARRGAGRGTGQRARCIRRQDPGRPRRGGDRRRTSRWARPPDVSSPSSTTCPGRNGACGGGTTTRASWCGARPATTRSGPARFRSLVATERHRPRGRGARAAGRPRVSTTRVFEPSTPSWSGCPSRRSGGRAPAPGSR